VSTETAVQLVVICRTGCASNGCEHLQQEVSLPTATLKNKAWTADEIEFIQETLNEPLGDVALLLNRTYYATAVTRSRVKRGMLKT
jgi:RNase P protein component